jgi:hypothetical protein
MRKPLDVLAEGLVSENNRGDWPSFEPMIDAIVKATLSSTPEAVVAVELLRISA